MSSELADLRAQLIQHVQSPDQIPLKQLGIFHTHQFQSLRAVTLHHPSIIFVVAGTKSLQQAKHSLVAPSGSMLVAPGDVTLNLTNEPSQQSGDYLALTVSFSETTLNEYKKLAGPKMVSSNELVLDKNYTTSIQCLAMPAQLLKALQQWVELCQQSSSASMLHRLKSLEVLAHLDEIGAADILLSAAQATWKSKVVTLIQSDLSAAWGVNEICQHLATSESSLRRNLQNEGTSFRELLEDCRLLAALGMLQESYRPIGQIAMDVGYANQGHFSERFKRRFGMSPTALRQTREPLAAS